MIMEDRIIKHLSEREQRVIYSLIRQQRIELEPLSNKGLEENVQAMLNVLESKGYLDQDVTYRRLRFEGALRNGVKNMAEFVPSDSYEWPLCIIQNAQQYKRTASIFMYFRYHHERNELFMSSLMTLKGLDTNFYSIGKENDVPHISSLKDIESRLPCNKNKKGIHQMVVQKQQRKSL